MTDLCFTVVDVRPETHAATPNLLFRLAISERTGERVHALALRCQVRIMPQQRAYSAAERDGLLELFGPAEGWGAAARPFLWVQTSAVLPGFTGRTEVDLPVTCTYDFEVVAAKYLHALRDGEIPLVLLFSGTVFTRGAGGFGVEQVPWHLEASYRLPVRVWRELMDAYFPGGGWIRLHRDSLDALTRYKAEHAWPSWERTIDALLARDARSPDAQPREAG